eukprot:360626-Chlamydomonas_euryale.AAC.1
MSVWLSVPVAQCQCGSMSVWLSVSVAQCQCGSMSVWLDVSVAQCQWVGSLAHALACLNSPPGLARHSRDRDTQHHTLSMFPPYCKHGCAVATGWWLSRSCLSCIRRRSRLRWRPTASEYQTWCVTAWLRVHVHECRAGALHWLCCTLGCDVTVSQSQPLHGLTRPHTAPTLAGCAGTQPAQNAAGAAADAGGTHEA